jgi:serine/threonine protein kinase/tetratricopeptide (TPR) repeat protein
LAESLEERDSAVVSSAGEPGPLSRLLREVFEAPSEDLLDGWKKELQPGDRVGRFEIRREVGRGGFGAVYEAFDTELNRVVAVKTLRLSRPRRDLSSDWIKKEAEAVARLDHPCIVTLYDVGTSPAGPYLVMELLRGKTLAQRIAEGPIPQAEALRIAEEMAKGLAHAHQRGVLHRDLKPANVFVCEDGRVKLLDFGLAHLLGTEGISGAGTPKYMAPEQARGEEVDQRADVYAAGRVLGDTLGERRSRGPERAVALATAADPAIRPKDGQAWLGILQTARHAIERPARVRRVVGLAGLGVLLGGGVAGVMVHRASSPNAQAHGEPSIAVLPFADLSPNQDQGHLSDGIAEEISSALTRVEGLKVIGRSSAFFFKGKSEDLQAIGQKLGVTTLLEGSLRKAGDRIRITAQLVKAADGVHLWSQTFDQPAGDMLEVQDEIAQAVVGALKLKLLPGAKTPGAGHRVNPEAHRLTLLGREYMRRGIAESDARAALEAYRGAITLEPGYALAWAGLSDALTWVSQSAPTEAAILEGKREALAAAEKAVALDPALPDGYWVRAYARRYATWDFEGAQADAEKALALSPGNSDALTLRAGLLMSMGRVGEAIPLLEKAASLDPLFVAGWGIALAHARLARGDTGGARAVLERARAITPENPIVPYYLGVAFLLEGLPEKALAAFTGASDEVWRVLGEALARHSLGQPSEARVALDILATRFGHSAAYQVAQVHAWRGEADPAFEWLDRAYRQHDGALTWVKFDPLMRSIRDDKRYGAMLRKLNLPLD